MAPIPGLKGHASHGECSMSAPEQQKNDPSPFGIIFREQRQMMVAIYLGVSCLGDRPLQKNYKPFKPPKQGTNSAKSEPPDFPHSASGEGSFLAM